MRFDGERCKGEVIWNQDVRCCGWACVEYSGRGYFLQHEGVGRMRVLGGGNQCVNEIEVGRHQRHSLCSSGPALLTVHFERISARLQHSNNNYSFICMVLEILPYSSPHVRHISIIPSVRKIKSGSRKVGKCMEIDNVPYMLVVLSITTPLLSPS